MAIARGGYSKVLRINLTNKTAKAEPIREEWLVDFVGGRGLGVRYLWDEIKPGTEPLGPENKIIFGVGPLAATLAQSMSRWMIVTKSPASGGYMRSIGGGMVGAELRFVSAISKVDGAACTKTDGRMTRQEVFPVSVFRRV